jgi:two-component system chemotaxis response regulator CheB
MNAWIKVRRSTGRSDDGNAAALAYDIVVVGTSWGGLAAMRAIVGELPVGYGIPIAIVQHRHPDSSTMLARFLQDYTRLRVCEVEDKQPIEAGHVYIAPANYHMLVEEGHFSLSLDAPVRYSRPSIDVALTSAAAAYGHHTVGVVLTGANTDGSAGLRRIADAGGIAVVQDPATAEVNTMPISAIRAVPTARVFPLDRIASFLGALPAPVRRASETG